MCLLARLGCELGLPLRGSSNSLEQPEHILIYCFPPSIIIHNLSRNALLGRIVKMTDRNNRVSKLPARSFPWQFFGGESGFIVTPNLVGVINGEIANVNCGSRSVDMQTLFFNTLLQITGNGHVGAICNFVNGQLQCNAGGGTLFEYCPLSALIITTTVDSGREQIQLEGEFS
jgi:hypothetical protein